jgi:diguanylate cyclase (GGDEF)-like protein
MLPKPPRSRLESAVAIGVPLQLVGFLSALIFVINGGFEVLVVNDLHAEQYGLIALFLVSLCLWAIIEVVLQQRRRPPIPLATLQLALGAQLLVVLIRHGSGWFRLKPMPSELAMASSPQFGMAIGFAPLYLLVFLVISKLIIDAFSYGEYRRACQLEAQLEALEAARLDLREARDAAEAANLALLAANAQLHGQATSDALTGLSNRRHFEAALADQVASSLRFHEPLALLFTDLDHFKTINDRFGHQCGDLVLVEMARLLKASLRKPDLVARWGGDEFIVMLPHTDGREALQLAEQIRVAVAVHVFPVVPAVSASFGVAELRAGESVEQWFARIDTVLYAAKAAGRNSVKLSDA